MDPEPDRTKSGQLPDPTPTGDLEPTTRPSTPPAAYPADPNEPRAPEPPPPDGHPINALERLLWIHPLTHLHDRSRFESKTLALACFIGDAALIVITYALLLAAVALLLWKLLAPLPELPNLPW